MTKIDWQNLELKAIGQSIEDENPIAHPAEMARYLVPLLLEGCTAEEAYEIARKFADAETFPHIAFRLTSDRNR